MYADPPESHPERVAPLSFSGLSDFEHVPMSFPLLVFCVHPQDGLQQSQYRVVCPVPEAPCAETEGSIIGERERAARGRECLRCIFCVGFSVPFLFWKWFYLVDFSQVLSSRGCCDIGRYCITGEHGHVRYHAPYTWVEGGSDIIYI